MTRYRTNADGSAVCPHRDLSVCPACRKDPNLVEASGAWFHFPEPGMADLARAEIARIRDEYAAEPDDRPREWYDPEDEADRDDLADRIDATY